MPSTFVTQHPSTFSLHLEIIDLRSAENVRLDLGVTLALRIAAPERFETQFAPMGDALDEAVLAGLLSDTVRTGLAPLIRGYALAELDANLALRGWLGTAISHALVDEADLAGRSGLEVLGIDAFDMRCEVWNEIRQVHQTYFLRASLAQAEAAGRLVVDKQVLAQVEAHLPIKERLVERKDRLATLEEREAIVDHRLYAARSARQEEMRTWVNALRTPPSQLRPELWRHTLGESVATAPLADAELVYVVTKTGTVHALSLETGEPAWPQPAQLDTTPGDGLALAADLLWVPGHDGVLYALHPATGTVQERIEVGGKLSSAPVAISGRLLISVDIDSRPAARPGAGHLAVVDLATRRVELLPVSQAGLRGRPVWDGQRVFLGDRRGGFFAVDLRRGRAEQLYTGRAHILGAALFDPTVKQIIFGDGHGLVTALNGAGGELWQHRVGGQVVGQPLLHQGLVYVGASDGKLYTLHPTPLQGQSPARLPFAAGGPIATPPVAWGDLVFVSANDGYLYALDAASGRLFWKYFSGSPIYQPPAVLPDGRLVVVDAAGNVSALRWCLSKYAEAARRLQDATPPPWSEVVELWLLAGEIEEALQAARQANRLDLAAELALGLAWHRQAAQLFEQLAQRQTDRLKATAWWLEAARAWFLEGDTQRAEACRLRDAQNRQVPLLVLQPANAPLLIQGEAGQVQVEVRNLGPALAHGVVVAYQGHVQQAGQVNLGAIGSQESRWVPIPVVPTESGSATLIVTATYADGQGVSQIPVSDTIPLRVGRPPEQHHHYYGPHVSGDGVIIMRGSYAPAGSPRVQVVGLGET